MTIYPDILPSSRTFTPGEYPHTVFQALSGKQSRVRHSSVMINSRLRLRYEVVEEADMIEILNHYKLVKGSLVPFALPVEVWSGNESANDFTLPGDAWRYLEGQPPRVEEVFCGGYIVDVELESLPGEGVGLLGIEATVKVLFVAGKAAAANGAQLSIQVSIEVGAGLASGATLSIPVSLTTTGNASGGTGAIALGSYYGIGAALIPGFAYSGLSRLFTITTSLSAGKGFSSNDPDFNNVQLLIHGWNGLVDASLVNRTVTAGPAITTTSNARFGGQALAFSQVDDSWIDIPEVALAGNSTVEAWIYLNSLPPDQSTGNRWRALAGFNQGAINGMTLQSSSGNIWVGFAYNQGGAITLTATSTFMTVGKWHHVRFVHDAGINRISVDGTIRATSSFDANPFSIKLDRIGYLDKIGNNGAKLAGALQEIRASTVARSTANFPIPTQSFPDSTDRLQGGTYGPDCSVAISVAAGSASSP